MSRKEVVGHVCKREFLRLLQGSGMDAAQATIVYCAEVGRHSRKQFPFSALKRALCVVACRLEPELRPASAFVRFVDRLVPGLATRRVASLGPARDASASVRERAGSK